MESERFLYGDWHTSHANHHPNCDNNHHTHDYTDANDHDLTFGNLVADRDHSAPPQRQPHQNADLHTSPDEYQRARCCFSNRIINAKADLDKHTYTEIDDYANANPDQYGCANHPADTDSLFDYLPVKFNRDLSGYSRIIFKQRDI